MHGGFSIGGKAVEIGSGTVVVDDERNARRRQTKRIADQYVEPVVPLQLVGQIQQQWRRAQWRRRLAGERPPSGRFDRQDNVVELRLPHNRRGFNNHLYALAGPQVRRRVEPARDPQAHRLAIVVGRVVGAVEFPDAWDLRLFDPIDQIVVWARDNLSWLTRPINDFIVGSVIVPVRDFLIQDVAWPVLVFITGWALWMVKGWRLAVFGMASIVLIGLMGMWALSIDTLVQVVTSTIIAAVIALPIGIWAGRKPRVEKALGPVLDALQTIPSLVYIIPVVILFTVGVVPGIIASVLYAMVPGIRITALGIRYVPEETVEASRTFGATPRQTMFGVRIPLAAPTIMAALNQVIMMVLAMVIIAGLVGAGGLGFETIRSLTRSLYGLGFEVGVAIVLMAMILDRYTQAWGERLQPPASI